MKKKYQQPNLCAADVQSLTILTVSVHVDGSNQQGPSWSDEETYDDALSKQRSDFGHYDW